LPSSVRRRVHSIDLLRAPEKKKNEIFPKFRAQGVKIHFKGSQIQLGLACSNISFL
jgi:hypothetical protein